MRISRIPRTLLFGLAASVLLAAPAVVRLAAQTATVQVPVTATVIGNCTIAATAVAFGNYDPVATNKTLPLDKNGSVTITCTKGTPAKIGLNLGDNAQTTTRRMAGGTGAFLTYELYQDSGHTIVWGNTGTAMKDAGVAASSAAQPFTIYGRVLPGQDVPVAPFNDTVVATVNF
jgi:spore coat protein U-like protein